MVGKNNNEGFDSYKRLFNYAYCESGLDMETKEAINWADQHIHFSNDDLARYEKLFIYAYSNSGLALEMKEAINWADQHINNTEPHK